MATSDPTPPPSLAHLPAVSPLAVQRARAFWRNLAWQLLPEVFVGAAGDGGDTVDVANAPLLAMVRGLHGSEPAPAALSQQATSRDDLNRLIAAGPVPVLGRSDDDERPVGRLDLACELLELKGIERVALELIAATEIDPITAYSARVLGGRLQRLDGNDVALVDDCFASAGLGSGVIRQLCGTGGLLRRIGAVIGIGQRQVGLSPALVAFLDHRLDAPSLLDEHRLQLRLPQPAFDLLERLRAPWIDVLERAVRSDRPVLLSGMQGFGGPAMAAILARRLGLGWRGVHVAPLVDAAAGRVGPLLAMVHAEARLYGHVWALHHLERMEAHFRDNADSLRRFVAALVDIGRPLLLINEGPVAPEMGARLAIEAGLLHIEVPSLPLEDRATLMATCLESAGVATEPAAALADQGKTYNLGAEHTAAAVAYAMQRAQLRAARNLAASQPVHDGVPTVSELNLACSTAMTNRLRTYGSRVHTPYGWDALVLDAETLASVHDIARFARVRERLFDDWGFAAKVPYGRALSAMFSGPSGTGKTMVAGLIARDLGVELYRVDLSRVVSKYIGETEERLGALFTEASQVGAALLFDEADSMFGKRTDIKSAHDRYANLEVNYLLQRLEEFDGVVILTTNFGTSIDEAFVRRLRFRVQFPFPTAVERARLWQVMLPAEMPLDDDDPLDLEWLAEGFELSGGHVRNTMLRAGMMAADASVSLSMRTLYDAAAAEYRELGKLAPAYPFDEDF